MRPTLNILSDDLIEQILTEAKRILAEVGMEVRGRALRQRLLDYGLPANDDRIFFPPEVVEWAIQQAPKSFKLYTRDGRPHAELGGNNVHFVPGSSGLRMLDHRTQEVRLANSRDFSEYIRLCDGLEHIAYPAIAFSTNRKKAARPKLRPRLGSEGWR